MNLLKSDSSREWRDYIIGTHAWMTCRIHMFLTGIVWLNVEYQHDFDYSKWLGPNTDEPCFDRFGTITPNHVSWIDIILLYGYFFPAFVAKKSVANQFGVQTVSRAIDCLFVDRGGTKEEKI
jgi:1-acyl-sn-glycerol-3-phosphate acyltransferase